MIYYLGWYKSERIQDFMRSGNNAATFKMGYVIRKIKELNKPITVVSCCTSDKVGRVPLREIKVDELQTEVYLSSWRWKGIFRKLTPFFHRRAIFKYLKEKIKKEDTLLVYHSLAFDKILRKAKKKIGFHLVLEVEEIYHVDIKCKNPIKAKRQEQVLLPLADKYIVVNDLIYDKYIANGKERIVLYGAYDGACDEKNCLSQEYKHVLFSGSLDSVRGVTLAIEAAAFLPKDYRLHICGAGAASFVEALKERIAAHNAKDNGCEIVFHGELSPKELDAVACSCDVGLNLQDVHNPFEAVSFPSKITFYLLHGLNVISTKMSSVQASRLKESLSFCDEQPQSVAKAIVEARLISKRENREAIRVLDLEAKRDLGRLLKRGNEYGCKGET